MLAWRHLGTSLSPKAVCTRKKKTETERELRHAAVLPWKFTCLGHRLLHNGKKLPDKTHQKKTAANTQRFIKKVEVFHLRLRKFDSSKHNCNSSHTARSFVSIFSSAAYWCHQEICSRHRRWKGACPAHRYRPDVVIKYQWSLWKYMFPHIKLIDLFGKDYKSKPSPDSKLRPLCVGHIWECHSMALTVWTDFQHQSTWLKAVANWAHDPSRWRKIFPQHNHTAAARKHNRIHRITEGHTTPMVLGCSHEWQKTRYSAARLSPSKKNNLPSIQLSWKFGVLQHQPHGPRPRGPVDSKIC